MKKFALVFIPFLFACNDKIHTVDDFIKDEKLFNTFYQKCENGELHKQDLNCHNVYKAKQEKQKLKWKEAREKSGAKL